VVRYLVYDLSELKIGQSVNFTSQRRPILIESMKCAVTKFKNKICKITLLSNNGGSRGGVQGVQTPALLFRCPF